MEKRERAGLHGTGWRAPVVRCRRLAGLALLLLLALGWGGCRRTDATRLRLGYFPNVTHAPALTGVESGRFARALAPLALETRVFNAGPSAIEALLAGAVDATYVGPGPALSGFLHTRGRGLRVIAGAASGGTLFVVRPGARIHGPGDLHGKRLATPQLGNTQDIALRRYLAAHGLATQERGGDVLVTPMENPNILTQFALGHLDGAWVPEPWGTRLVVEAGAEILLDERDLWPGRAFAMTLLVVRTRYLRDAPQAVERLARAHGDEVRWLQAHPADGQALANRAIARLTGRAVPEAVLATAWRRIDFTTDPLLPTVRESARAAQALGFLPSGDLSRLVDEASLRRATQGGGP